MQIFISHHAVGAVIFGSLWVCKPACKWLKRGILISPNWQHGRNFWLGRSNRRKSLWTGIDFLPRLTAAQWLTQRTLRQKSSETCKEIGRSESNQIHLHWPSWHMHCCQNFLLLEFLHPWLFGNRSMYDHFWFMDKSGLWWNVWTSSCKQHQMTRTTWTQLRDLAWNCLLERAIALT